MMSVKFLSMTSYCLALESWVCEMFVKRGTLQKSGREVLREEILKIKTLFSI